MPTPKRSLLHSIRLTDASIVILALFPIVLIVTTIPPFALAVALVIYGFFLFITCCVGILVGYLIQMQSTRRQIERQKDEFLSFASHQLRTPLTTVRWRVEMLISGDAGAITKKQCEFLSEIEESTKRMVALVNQFLNVSRINLGTFSINPERCDTHALIAGIVQELQPLTAKRKLRIVTQFNAADPFIICDPRITRILVFNLLANAITYTPKGTITVSTRRTHSSLIINIADQGVGIPADQQHSIFTKLFRADNTEDLNPHGSGLGLYIVKTLLDRIGGGISFTSTEGVGTTFVLTLPLKTLQPSQKGTKDLISSLIE